MIITKNQMKKIMPFFQGLKERDVYAMLKKIMLKNKTNFQDTCIIARGLIVSNNFDISDVITYIG